MSIGFHYFEVPNKSAAAKLAGIIPELKALKKTYTGVCDFQYDDEREQLSIDLEFNRTISEPPELLGLPAPKLGLPAPKESA